MMPPAPCEATRNVTVSRSSRLYGSNEIQSPSSLNAALEPVRQDLPETLRATVKLIDENCEPSLCTVLFMAGAGGSLRAGVTKNPVRLTRSVQGRETRLTAGGAPCYIWPGGGITFMVDVTRLHTADPENHVPHLAFQPEGVAALPWLSVDDTVTSYYFRMRVADQPGVLADITRNLADGRISIDALFQREPSEGENQTDIIMLTHDALERDVNAAIARIEALPTVLAPVIRVRQEELL